MQATQAYKDNKLHKCKKVKIRMDKNYRWLV